MSDEASGWARFQSLIGRLKTAYAAAPALNLNPTFQSLIGRLKTQFGFEPFWAQSDLSLFQSLIGRLKTESTSTSTSIPSAKFQSLIGRLKTNPHTASAAGFELKSQL